MIFDYVYRGYKSVAVFIRYWGNSAVGLPEINVHTLDHLLTRLTTFTTPPHHSITHTNALLHTTASVAGPEVRPRGPDGD